MVRRPRWRCRQCEVTDMIGGGGGGAGSSYTATGVTAVTQQTGANPGNGFVTVTPLPTAATGAPQAVITSDPQIA